MEQPLKTIAKNLNISIGTVHNICSLFETTGDVNPKKLDRLSTRLLSPYDEHIIVCLLLDHPGLYLGEICKTIETSTGIKASCSTVCRIIQRNGFTRKKIQQVALQRSIEFRGDFMAEMQFFSIDQIVWLDETGCDKRDHIRRFGYAMRGEYPACHRFIQRGRRVSAVAAMCSEGVIAVELIEGTFNGDKFVEFVTGTLVPQMHQFDGTSSRSVLVMDNCAIHHIAKAQEILVSAGILTIFLPPYSPDLNPAEELFSYVKYYLKKHDDVLMSVSDMKPILIAAFNSVVIDDCLGWIHHCGYI